MRLTETDGYAIIRCNDLRIYAQTDKKSNKTVKMQIAWC